MKKTQKEFTAAVWRRVEEKREAEKKRARLVRRLSFAAASAACLFLVIGLFPALRKGEGNLSDMTRSESHYSVPAENCAQEEPGVAEKSGTAAPAPSAADSRDGQNKEEEKPDTEAPGRSCEEKSPQKAAPETSVYSQGEASGPVRVRILDGETGLPTASPREEETEFLLSDPAGIARLEELIGALTAEEDSGLLQAGGIFDRTAGAGESEIVLKEKEGILFLDGTEYRVGKNAAWRELADFLRRCAEKAE